MGGIETGTDAAQFMLLGSHTVQVCTGAMLRGYEIIAELKADLEKFMVDHEFTDLRQFIGKSLPYFSTHHDLVSRQKQAKADKAGHSNRDAETWKGAIARETEALTTN
jgi:dihydropyrimidine dehydrogenase (NADP+)